MKNFILFLLILFSACQKEMGCVEITLKEETNGMYYFYWGAFNNFSGVSEQGANQPFSGSVTRKEYVQYEVGDIYCRD